MGRDIIIFDDEYTKSSEDLSSPLLVQQMVRQVRSLHPDDLRSFFESIFQKMTITSKEAMTEIMWTGLSTSEQQAFEMPYFGHRWSQASIHNALQAAFQQQPEGSAAHVRAGRTIRLADSGTSHFSAGVSTRGVTTRDNDEEVQALEEQFFSILRDAIHRAERSGPNGGAIRVNVQTSNAGVNTHNTDDPHLQRRL
jgi:hypothetical protein